MRRFTLRTMRAGCTNWATLPASIFAVWCFSASPSGGRENGSQERNGVMEYWSIGFQAFPAFQHSITPSPQVSVQPPAKNLDHAHPAPRPVTSRRKIKSPCRPVVDEFDRMRRNVRIVGLKLDFSLRLRESEQHDSVVDGDAGKPEEMHGGHRALAHALRQLPGHPLLVPRRNHKNHAPMAAHKIGLPRAAAFRLEQRFMRLAEGAQTVIAGDHDPLRFRARPAGIARDDLADEPAIGFRVHRGPARVETGMIKKLPRRPDHYEAPMGIDRRWITGRNTHRPRRRIEAILPDQLVGKSKSVPLELERAGAVVWWRTHCAGRETTGRRRFAGRNRPDRGRGHGCRCAGCPHY